MNDYELIDYDKQINDIYNEIERLKQPSNIKKASRLRAFKIILNSLYSLIILLLLSMLILIQVTKELGEVPSLFSYQLFYIQTGSMEPTFPVGSVVLSKQIKDDQILSSGEEGIKDGDIVTFYDLNGQRITHRIESVITLENGDIAYLTRGDNINNTTDSEILTKDRIIGKVIMKIV